MPRARVIYTGRVQGVGFRATAHAAARGLRIVGFVRNERDGSVLLEAQVEGDEVDALVSEIARRMERNIQGVVRAHIPNVEGEQGFTIER